MLKKVMRSGKSWKIHYSYWTGNRNGKTEKLGTTIVNSTYKPTRTAAMQYARDALIDFMGHSRGQYGYSGLQIKFIGTTSPLLNSTKQKNGTPPAREQIPTQSSISEE